jgi:predicted Zn-dependent protease
MLTPLFFRSMIPVPPRTCARSLAGIVATAMLVAVIGAHAEPPCQAEVLRANTTLSRIFREWPLHPSGDGVAGPVQRLTDELAARSGESSSRRWRTHIVRDRNLNAFSVGDGHIFITEGMLSFVRNEGELAALLAHEFGHHLAGHFCEERRRRGFFGNIFGGRDRETAARKQVGSLTALIDPEKERAADMIAVRVLDRAGYDPRAAIELAMRMARNGSGAHFQYEHRIEALNDLLVTRPARTTPTPPDSSTFVELKQALQP